VATARAALSEGLRAVPSAVVAVAMEAAADTVAASPAVSASLMAANPEASSRAVLRIDAPRAASA